MLAFSAPAAPRALVSSRAHRSSGPRRRRKLDEDDAAFDFDRKGCDLEGVAAQAFAVRQRERLLVQRAGDLRRAACVADDAARRAPWPCVCGHVFCVAYHSPRAAKLKSAICGVAAADRGRGSGGTSAARATRSRPVAKLPAPAPSRLPADERGRRLGPSAGRARPRSATCANGSSIRGVDEVAEARAPLRIVDHVGPLALVGVDEVLHLALELVADAEPIVDDHLAQVRRCRPPASRARPRCASGGPRCGCRYMRKRSR